VAKEKELLELLGLVRDMCSTKGKERTLLTDRAQDLTLANLESFKGVGGQLSIKPKRKYKRKTYKKTCTSRRV
jgi:hypothetical protein